MSALKIGRSHKARKALFTRGIRRGFLSVEEIDEALPPGSLTDAERWLLYYSLKASRVEIRDSEGNSLELEERPPEVTNSRRRIDARVSAASEHLEEPMEMEADTQH
jgi:hypothetical protein